MLPCRRVIARLEGSARAYSAVAGSSRSAWLRERVMDVAVSQVRSGDANAAQSSVTKVLRVGGPTPSSAAQVKLARVLAASGDVDGARARLEAALASSRNDDVVNVAVADVFVALGERERAQQVLDGVLARRARDPRVQPSLPQVRARVLSARLRVEAGDTSDALAEEMRDAVTWLRRLRGSEHTESLAALRVWASLLQSRGALTEARTLLEYVGAVLQRNVAKASEAHREAVLGPISEQYAQLVALLPTGASTRPHSLAPRAYRDAIIAADNTGRANEEKQPKWRLEKLRKKRKELHAQQRAQAR